MSDEHQRSLDELGQRMKGRGFVCRYAPYFAASGIIVSTPSRRVAFDTSRDTADLEFSVIDRRVALYPVATGWEARVGRHDSPGGPDWICGADTLDGLEALALQALGTSEIPPGPDWRVLGDDAK
ncbi:hypothetical protein ACN469_01185 [Corallococcus terminator]